MSDVYSPDYRKPDGYYMDRPCQGCGQLMEDASPYRRKCWDCRVERDRRAHHRRSSNCIAKADRQAVLARENCQRCGRATSPGNDRYGHDLTPEIDHILSLEKGGTSVLANLQLLCRRCNRSKGWQ